MNLRDGHHLRDFWHTVVPISYCNFVVLDKAWCEIARQVQQRLRETGLLTNEAEIFPTPEELTQVTESFAGDRSRGNRAPKRGPGRPWSGGS